MTSEKSYDNEQRLNLLWNALGNYALNSSLSSYALSSSIGPMGTYMNATSWADTGGLSNGWGKGTSGYFKYMRFFTNVWFVAANALNCTGATVADGTTILTAANAGWASPATSKRYVAYCDAIKVNGSSFQEAALNFNSDGSVQCYGVSTAATFLSCFGVLFVDI